MALGWFGGVLIAGFVLWQIPGDQGFGKAFMLGCGCALLGMLIGKAADR